MGAKNTKLLFIDCLPVIVGGNWDNGANCGLFNCNVNNAPSNANANIGARLKRFKKPALAPCHMAKIKPTNPN